MSSKVFLSTRSFDDATQVQQKAPSAYQRSPRFNYWLVFFICSLIVVGSSIEAVSIWMLVYSNILCFLTHLFVPLM